MNQINSLLAIALCFGLLPVAFAFAENHAVTTPFVVFLGLSRRH